MQTQTVWLARIGRTIPRCAQAYVVYVLQYMSVQVVTL